MHYDHGVCATVMNCGRDVIESGKLPADEVGSFLDRYPIDKVAIESSRSIMPVRRASRGKFYTILVQARSNVAIDGLWLTALIMT